MFRSTEIVVIGQLIIRLVEVQVAHDVFGVGFLAFDDFRKRVPGFPESQLLSEDFFKLVGQFDLILEQTFFCALPPSARPNYVEKMHELLSKDGQLAGVLFDFPLSEKGPPFGGSKEEYERLFSEKFEIKKLDRCYNSIKPREGSELFIRVLKLA